MEESAFVQNQNDEATPLMGPSFSPGASSTPSIISVYYDAQEEIVGEENRCSASEKISGQNDKDMEPQPLLSRTSTIRRNEDDEQCQRDSNLKRARRLLYLSHLFAQASEVSWQFCLVLFLSAFTDYESLALVSTYGIMSGLAVCLAGGRAGKFVDDTPRLHAARVFIWTENCAVLLATLCCYFLLPSSSKSDEAEAIAAAKENSNQPTHLSWIENRMYGMTLSTRTITLLLGLHILGSLANVLDRGFMVAIERDWVVVMSQQVTDSSETPATGDGDNARSEKKGDHTQEAKDKWLSQTNVTMRQIDLSCKVAAPTLAGYIVVAFGEQKADLRAACVFVGVLNVLSLLVEYECTARIYRLVPALADKEDAVEPSLDEASEDLGLHIGTSGGEVDVSGVFEDVAQVDFAEPDIDITEWSRESQASLEITHKGPRYPAYLPRRLSRQKRKARHCIPFPSEWLIYLDQEVAPAGLALAFLYVNILSFGAIMTSYLVWRQMRMDAIGFWRGVSSAIGLCGTVCFHKSVDVWGLSLETTGEWSIMFQFSCLLICYASLFVQKASDVWSLGLLIGGTCASRVGLWVFDISVTQLMQQRVPHDVRGVVGGVQQSLHALFGLATFVLGLVFPNPRDFHYFIEVGCSGVGLALLLFTFGIFLKQPKKQTRSDG